ncbi:MAG: hypothetical protein E7436_01360 [Ruminococcaceae bacterium]|nr:hypothetical protein [Oscillospiraceae bacterium]
MNKFLRRILMALLVFAMLTSSLGLGVFVAATEEPTVITHTFGGDNGEWELDTDNSEGIWSYYTTYGMIATIQPTELVLTNEQTGRTTGEAYYALNRDGFMHPGASSPWSMPVVALEMEESGTLKAVMNATKNESGGNGVVVKFFRNDDDGRLVEKVLTAAGSHTMEAETKVNKGDIIYFMVHHNNDIVSDGATYVLTYTLTVGEGADDTREPTEPKPTDAPTEPAPTEPAPTVPDVVCCEENCAHTADTCYCAADCGCENCAAFHDKLTGKTDAVNNIDDFRGVQGFSDLTYLYGLVSEGLAGLKPLEQNTGTMWDTAGVVPYLGIRADGLMHPGLGVAGELYQPALVWTAPRDMVIDVYFDVLMELESNGGDGVVVSIYLNDQCLKVLDMTIEDGTASTEPTVVEFNTIKVSEGDTLTFVVDPKTNITCDGTLVYAEITWLKEEKPDDGEGNQNGNTNDNNNDQSGTGNSQTGTGSDQNDADNTGWIWIGLAGAAVIAVIVVVIVVIKKKKSDRK